MGGSSAEKNAVFEFLHFGETSSAASEISPGGRNYGGRNPPSFAGSTAFRVLLALTIAAPVPLRRMPRTATLEGRTVVRKAAGKNSAGWAC